MYLLIIHAVSQSELPCSIAIACGHIKCVLEQVFAPRVRARLYMYIRQTFRQTFGILQMIDYLLNGPVAGLYVASKETKRDTIAVIEIGGNSADKSMATRARTVYMHIAHLSKIFKSVFVRQDVGFIRPTMKLHCPAVCVLWFFLHVASTGEYRTNGCNYIHHHQHECNSPHL